MGMPVCGRCRKRLRRGKVVPLDACRCAGDYAVVQRALYAASRSVLGQVDRRPLWARALETYRPASLA